MKNLLTILGAVALSTGIGASTVNLVINNNTEKASTTDVAGSINLKYKFSLLVGCDIKFDKTIIVNIINEAKTDIIKAQADLTAYINTLLVQAHQSLDLVTKKALITTLSLSGSLSLMWNNMGPTGISISCSYSLTALFSITNVSPCGTAVDISTAKVTDPCTLAANPCATYSVLNTNSVIANLVTSAINVIQPNTDAQITTDFILTNDQVASANQVAGTSVKFTVSVVAGSKNLVQGTTFSFTIVLQK